MNRPYFYLVGVWQCRIPSQSNSGKMFSRWSTSLTISNLLLIFSKLNFRRRLNSSSIAFGRSCLFAKLRIRGKNTFDWVYSCEHVVKEVAASLFFHNHTMNSSRQSQSIQPLTPRNARRNKNEDFLELTWVLACRSAAQTPADHLKYHNFLSIDLLHSHQWRISNRAVARSSWTKSFLGTSFLRSHRSLVYASDWNLSSPELLLQQEDRPQLLSSNWWWRSPATSELNCTIDWKTNSSFYLTSANRLQYRCFS